MDVMRALRRDPVRRTGAVPRALRATGVVLLVLVAGGSLAQGAAGGVLDPRETLRGVMAYGPAPVAAPTPLSPSAAVPRVAAPVRRPLRESIGPLFLSGLAGAHSCTASVVSSTSGEVLLTAAHCLSGTGAGAVFAPGFHDGVAPFGTWVVKAAFVSPDWVADQDPLKDYAFLRVVPSATNASSSPVEAVVGANRLAVAPAPSRRVVVTGYGAGTGGRPVSCRTSVSLTGEYPTFDCPGFVAGTSGGPWVSAEDPASREVVGVIGGLHNGGCYEDTSYSAPFDGQTISTYERAVADHVPDVLPSPPGDDC